MSAFLEDLQRIAVEYGFWPLSSDNNMKLEIPKMNEKSRYKLIFDNLPKITSIPCEDPKFI